jgi:anti-sigma-K factor RskA
MTDASETPDVLAGELALRVLSPAEEAAARAREASDPAFAAQIDDWNTRIAAFADEIAPVQPSPAVWPRVEAATAPAANDNERLVFWRRWAVGSTGLLAASVAALAIMVAQPAQTPVAPVAPAAPGGITKVATLTLGDGDVAAMTLVYDSATGNLYLAPTDKMAGDTRVPHLWLVMPDEGGVQLIGAIDGSETSRHSLSGALPTMAGRAVAVAVSMEEPGHTPDAHRPDGPVVASGELQNL